MRRRTTSRRSRSARTTVATALPPTPLLRKPRLRPRGRRRAGHHPRAALSARSRRGRRMLLRKRLWFGLWGSRNPVHLVGVVAPHGLPLGLVEDRPRRADPEKGEPFDGLLDRVLRRLPGHGDDDRRLD